MTQRTILNTPTNLEVGYHSSRAAWIGSSLHKLTYPIEKQHKMLLYSNNNNNINKNIRAVSTIMSPCLISVWFNIDGPLMSMPIFLSLLPKVASDVPKHDRLHNCNSLHTRDTQYTNGSPCGMNKNGRRDPSVYLNTPTGIWTKFGHLFEHITQEVTLSWQPEKTLKCFCSTKDSVIDYACHLISYCQTGELLSEVQVDFMHGACEMPADRRSVFESVVDITLFYLHSMFRNKSINIQIFSILMRNNFLNAFIRSFSVPPQ